MDSVQSCYEFSFGGMLRMWRFLIPGFPFAGGNTMYGYFFELQKFAYDLREGPHRCDGREAEKLVFWEGFDHTDREAMLNLVPLPKQIKFVHGEIVTYFYAKKVKAFCALTFRISASRFNGWRQFAQQYSSHRRPSLAWFPKS
jgi:hypothetical protein